MNLNVSLGIRRIIKTLVVVIMSISYVNTYAQSTGINWQRLLNRSDMVFDTLTTKWDEGAFVGNGLLGTMVYMKDDNALRFEIGRTDVVDHREGINELFGKCRLPIGYFVLRPNGRIVSNTARVDLWNAEIRGHITTTKGSIQWRALTFSQTNIILVEAQYTGDEKSFSWAWVPEESVSSRLSFQKQSAPPGYKANPAGALHTKGNNGISYYNQPMLAGGSYTTAWQSAVAPNKKTFLISVGYALQNGLSDSEAFAAIKKAAAQKQDALLNAHRNWWHQYYRQSFITMPDALLESFYWIQQYKIASASRKNKPLIDLMGPWFYPTPWPAYWWNLNIQLTYSSLYTANHLAIASVLPAVINKNVNNLINNAPEKYRYNALALGRAGGIGMNAPITVTTDTLTKNNPPAELELGDATWVLYYYWLQYRYSMDKHVLAGLYPILKRSINYYLDVLQKEADGKYHLPYTSSPEYPGGTTRDCNYDLSLLRWGCQTLIQANSLLGENDPLKAKWQDVLQNLTDYPTNANGLMIGRDVPFSISHRHFSHMLMIYPLHVMNWEQPGSRELIEKSLKHWHSMPAAMQGYSFTGGASIYATMHRGNEARDYLHTLITKFVKPNTMYVESGPVIETPLAAVASIQELYIQSWGNKVRVFPAMPDDWADAAFKNLRTEGAFLVSAVRKNKITQWVSIKAGADGICNIDPNIPGLVKLKSARPIKLVNKGEGLYQIAMKKGETVVLYADAAALKQKITETKTDTKAMNPFGKKSKN